MRNFVSQTAADIPPSGIRKFFDLVNRTPGAISLGVGEPNFPTPQYAKAAAVRSFGLGQTGYTSNRVICELRNLISRYLKERFNVLYPDEQIIITVGASEAIDLALRTVCDRGDEILIPSPCYVAYAPVVTLAGGVAVSVECTEEDGFSLTPENLQKAITPKTKAIILSYPNNPTGAVMSKEQIKAIAPVICGSDLLVIADEIYAELNYCGSNFSIASIPEMRERTVYMGGFSKAFAMTGWRTGFICSPKEIDRAALKIHQHTIICAPQAGQRAAVCALEEGFKTNFKDVEKMRKDYFKRGTFLSNALNNLGMNCLPPRGAFYVFANVSAFDMDGGQFAEGLLNEQKVAVVPGEAFGAGGKNFVRCSFASPQTDLEQAVLRIGAFLKGRALL